MGTSISHYHATLDPDDPEDFILPEELPQVAFSELGFSKWVVQREVEDPIPGLRLYSTEEGRRFREDYDALLGTFESRLGDIEAYEKDRGLDPRDRDVCEWPTVSLRGPGSARIEYVQTVIFYRRNVVKKVIPNKEVGYISGVGRVRRHFEFDRYYVTPGDFETLAATR